MNMKVIGHFIEPQFESGNFLLLPEHQNYSFGERICIVFLKYIQYNTIIVCIYCGILISTFIQLVVCKHFIHGTVITSRHTISKH